MTLLRCATVLTALAWAGLPHSAFSQAKLEVSSLDGGPVTTSLGYGVTVTKDSSLHRQWFVTNDPSCPASLAAAGINTAYTSREYSFTPSGTLTAKEPISAFEVRFMIFDVWGDHMKTLSGTELRDVAPGSPFQLASTGSWRAWENDVSDYLTSVGFIAHVRTAAGRAWSADSRAVLREVEGVKLRLTQEQLEPAKPKE
jgi:hypothetical protein